MACAKFPVSIAVIVSTIVIKMFKTLQYTAEKSGKNKIGEGTTISQHFYLPVITNSFEIAQLVTIGM